MTFGQTWKRRLLPFAAVLVFATTWPGPIAGAAQESGYIYEELTQVYSVEEAAFLQWFSDGYSFRTSVPQGEAALGIVSLDFPPELKWSLEYGGAPEEYASGEYLFQPGAYVFTVLTPDGVYSEFSFSIAEPDAGPGSAEGAIDVALTHSYRDGMYVYTFENGRSYSANIPNGSVTNYGVTLQMDGELIYVLTRNGSAMRYEPGQTLTEDGYYHMRIISPMVVQAPDLSEYLDDSSAVPSVDLEALEKEIKEFEFSEEGLGGLTVGDIYQTFFSFRIVTRPTRDIAVFNVPPGFEFASVYLNGGRIEPSEIYSHRMSKDGDYVISLKDAVSSAPEHMVRLTVKMSPPAVTLEGAVNRQSSPGPVSIRADEGVALTVYRNNMQAAPADSYSERGRYQVIAVDEAGNTARLSFEIVFSLPRSFVLALILVALVAGLSYMIYARRSMSV